MKRTKQPLPLYDTSNDVSHLTLSQQLMAATAEQTEKLLAETRARADFISLWAEAHKVIEIEKAAARAIEENHQQEVNLVVSYYKIHQALYDGEDTVWKKTKVSAIPTPDELKKPSILLKSIERQISKEPSSRSAHALRLAKTYSLVSEVSLAENKALIKEIHTLSYLRSGFFAKHANFDEPNNPRTEKIIQALKRL